MSISGNWPKDVARFTDTLDDECQCGGKAGSHSKVPPHFSIPNQACKGFTPVPAKERVAVPDEVSTKDLVAARRTLVEMQKDLRQAIVPTKLDVTIVRYVVRDVERDVKLTISWNGHGWYLSTPENAEYTVAREVAGQNTKDTASVFEAAEELVELLAARRDAKKSYLSADAALNTWRRQPDVT